MRTIEVDSDKFGKQIILVDDEDYDYLIQWKWYVAKPKNILYAKRQYIPGESTLMHRVIMGLKNPKILVDHINHDGLDNQRNNLRICTFQENARNISQNNSLTQNSTSKYKGVDWRKDKNKWRSRLGMPNGDIFLGHFTNEVDAARAYNEAAIKHFGEFASLNILKEI